VKKVDDSGGGDDDDNDDDDGDATLSTYADDARCKTHTGNDVAAVRAKVLAVRTLLRCRYYIGNYRRVYW
jgi:hypothetical protein